MDNEKLYKKAYALAFHAHLGQVDKAGDPYFKHVETVSDSLSDIRERIVGLLHDVIEDTDLTLNDLRNEGFTSDIIAAVDAITHRENESNTTYYKRILENPMACHVKIADLTHNMDLSRLGRLCEKDYHRNEQYSKYLSYLKEHGTHGLE